MPGKKGVVMKNYKILGGILAVLLVFGLAFIGCDSDSGEEEEPVATVLTLSRPVWSAKTENKDNVNEFLTRLWSNAPSSLVQGIQIGQVFSYNQSSRTLTVNTADTEDVKTWITTQWGGTSLPVKVSANKGLTVTDGANQDPNWSNASVIWLNIAAIADGENTVTLSDNSEITYTIAENDGE
jgi:hypothetical protein